MITIVIHANEICTENVRKLIVCLEPGRGIDRHAYREDTVAAAYRYRYRGPVWVDDIDPVWVDDIDPVWIIITTPFGSYRDHCLVQ